MDTVRAFRRATHHQIRHVGGQNRRRQLKGAEPHRQRQAEPAAAAVGNARAAGHRRHDRHQQRDAPHVGRHHERQGVAQEYHAGDHPRPGVGEPGRQRLRRPVRQSGFTDGDAEHKAAEHQPERRRGKAAEDHLRRSDFRHHCRCEEQQRGDKFRQQRRRPEHDGDADNQ